MLVHSIHPRFFLGFGECRQSIPLRALNVFIGANGVGKSNLIEAFDLLKNAPSQLTKTIRLGGGVRDWLWKGKGAGPGTEASLDVLLHYPKKRKKLRYFLSFAEEQERFALLDERLEDETPFPGHSLPVFYYHYKEHGGAEFRIVDSENRSKRNLRREQVDPARSVLAQRQSPEDYPEITWLKQAFEQIAIYREWSFGRNALYRMPQKTDLPGDHLEPDIGNLALVLNDFRFNHARDKVLEALGELYAGLEDYEIRVKEGTAQLFLKESGMLIPATRLSDGTLRYLCLLAILCHPNPPPVICLEEPELGLHPDIMPTVARLLKAASARCQLIVTTHSDALVGALTEDPEDVVVCDKDADGTIMRRLDPKELAPWLEQYRLGQLWLRGDLGGTRW